jgi:hypothetical protein
MGKACTGAVISGKATPDGRPLLWKNRDTNFFQNSVKYFKGAKYSFIGIVNSQAKYPSEIWMGTNSTGFSIMNTLSYNIEKDTGHSTNGNILYKALAVCTTVADFQHLLDTIAKPSGIRANIGVIDAQGGAVLFEVGYHSYTMFDANNSEVAPNGYVARTNFSFTGEKDQGAGYVRYCTEEATLQKAAAAHTITPQWIFGNLSRSFVNQQLGINLKDGHHNKPETSGWFVDQDFIPRYTSTSTTVIQGVKVGENPELTTMWTILGYPPVSVAFPLWVKGGDTLLPTLLTSDTSQSCTPFGKKVDSLKSKVFSYHKGKDAERYFYWEALYNQAGNGIMQQLVPVENEIFSRSHPSITKWQKNNKVDEKELQRLYNNLSIWITDRYKSLFGI